ncbi:MAG: N,N-dimethylformamidase beta subunit family domain-containing protein [Rhizomicrobium sp.]
MPEIADPIDQDSADRAYATLPALNGYAQTFSVFVGEPVHVRIARKPSRDLRGHGHKARGPIHVSRIKIRNVVTGKFVATVRPAARTQIFEQQPASFKDEGAAYGCLIAIDTAALAPGLHECVVTDSTAHVSKEIYFNLKPRAVAGYDIVCVLPTFTWHAYNRVGGGSFYNNTKGPELSISLHRPLSKKRDNFVDAAIPFLQTFEQERIRWACIDSSDLHFGSLPSGKAPVLALLTHDEYWSQAMRDRIDRYLDARGVVLVAAGNVCWWRVEVDGSNVTVRKKNGQEGLWVHNHLPEETTFVSSFRFGGYPIDVAQKMPRLAKRVANLTPAQIAASRALTVIAPEHPLFNGVALDKDHAFGGDVPIMYREIDGIPIRKDGKLWRKRYGRNRIAPKILATGIVIRGYRGSSRARKVGVVVEAQVRHGHVLHLGTFGWSLGLSKKNKDVRQILLNAYRYCRALAK